MERNKTKYLIYQLSECLISNYVDRDEKKGGKESRSDRCLAWCNSAWKPCLASQHPLPQDGATRTQRLTHALMCPPHGWYNQVFGSFGLSTKGPCTIMLCLSLVVSESSCIGVSIGICAHPPRHRVICRNFIFGIHMHICPPHIHMKYLVILTCSF